VQGCHFLGNNTNELPVQSSAHQSRKEDGTKEYLSTCSSLHTRGEQKTVISKSIQQQSLVFLPFRSNSYFLPDISQLFLAAALLQTQQTPPVSFYSSHLGCNTMHGYNKCTDACRRQLDKQQPATHNMVIFKQLNQNMRNYHGLL
jgi:hypothetical protein